MKEGDLVLGTVTEVTNTITFVKLENGEKGTIISSEIAPGRIKHLREYVVPNKKIVCKILNISGDNIELSLRRVNSKEKKEIMQDYKQLQATKSAFKRILEDDFEKVEKKILEEFDSLKGFMEKSRDEPKIVDKYIPKEKVESIKKITERRKKKAELRLKIKLKCLEDDGIARIKQILNLEDKDIEITYISAGNFLVKILAEDYKNGKKKLHEISEEIEKRAKEKNCEFSSEEEK